MTVSMYKTILRRYNNFSYEKISILKKFSFVIDQKLFTILVSKINFFVDRPFWKLDFFEIQCGKSN